MKKVLVPQPENQDDAQWCATPLWRILFFLQPEAGLQQYNRSKAHNALIEASGVDYGRLPPLQQSPYAVFNDEIRTQVEYLQNHYDAHRTTRSLMRIVFDCYRGQILYYISVVQACAVTKMLVSYLLSRTLYLVAQQHVDNKSELLLHASLLSIMLVMQVLTEQHYFQNIYQVSVKIRYGLVALLYRKLNRTTITRIKTSGQFFNLISMDLNEIDSGLTWFLALSGSIIVGTVGSILLYVYFGPSCTIGIGVLIAVNVASRRIIDSTGRIKAAKNKAQDGRTRMTSEVLHNIRALKTFAIELLFRDKLVKLRSEQDQCTYRLLVVDALAQCMTGNLSVFVSLMAMIVPYVYLFNGKLAVESMFGAIWVLQLIKVWCLTYFYRGRKFWVNIKLVAQRMSEILTLEDVVHHGSVVSVSKKAKRKGLNIEMFDEEVPSEQQEINVDVPAVSILLQDYSAWWDAPVLRNLNFNLERLKQADKGILISIVGRLGSAKSALLLALLGEPLHSTGLCTVRGSVAYVEQSPYIFSGTIQENILFGRVYDAERYQFALRASCLEGDHKDDQAQVGDRGAKLSGGQRARVAFARALYSRAQIVLLDDILAAVDTRVARTMFQQGVLALRDEGAVVVLVTHHHAWAALSDHVLLMENGTITKEANGANAIQQLLSVDAGTLSDTEAAPTEEPTKTVDEQPTIPSSIAKEVYRRYIQEAGGYRILLLIVLNYLCDAYLNMTLSKYFGQWAESSTREHGRYLRTAIVLVVAYMFMSFGKVLLLFNRTVMAVANMHRKLCTSTVRSQMSYFDNTPVGSILARFTNDLNNIEGMVMLDTHWVLEGCIDNVFVIIVISLQNVVIVMAAVGILAWMFLAKSHVTNYMKYAVKCDDLSRSQLFDFIECSISGVTLVRTYQQQHFFQERLMQLIYRNMQSYFAFLRLNALIGFIFEVSLHVLIIISLFALLCLTNKDPQDVGFSLLMLLSLGYMFSLNLRGQIYLDIDMQNVHRVLRSIDVPSEGEFEYDNDYQIQLNNWPQTGAIEFRNVTVNYKRTLQHRAYALKNVSFRVAPGEYVGVVGRTGAGKSSLLAAILRMVDLESGSLLIDEIDIDSVGVHTLREKLLVIPQHAPILGVSIRENIDPKHEHSDQQIWNCLDRVGLERIKELSEKLDTVASETMFSAGERQLFSLCRVLLHPKPRILLFDEATANIDAQTDELVQSLIASAFPRVTKIVIAHRLQTVMSCDRVMVMDKGEIVEFDKPSTLLERNGLFKQMNM